MAKKNIVASTSQPKKPKLPEIVEIHSNLRRSSHRMVHRIEFSNTANDPIEVEEMGNLSESNEQGSAFGEEAPNEEDSRDVNNALSLEDMTEDFLDEKTIATREGQYEHALYPLPSFSLVCSSSFSFFVHTFIFPYLIPSISPGFTTASLSSRGKDRHPLGLVFLDQSTPALQSLVRPPSDSDVATARSTMSHLLSLD